MPEEWASLELQKKTHNSQAEAQIEGRDQILKNGEFSRGQHALTSSPTLQFVKALKKWEYNKFKPKHQISPRNPSFCQ